LKPQARIQAVIDILEILAQRNLPMDLIVGDYMRTRRYIGSKDRSNIAERLYDMARHQARLGWHLQQAALPDTPRSRALAWLSVYEGADKKRIKDIFDGSKYAPEPLGKEELAALDAFDAKADMPEAIACECPPQYEEQLRSIFGDNFKEEMAAMLQPATLDLRVNTFLTTVEEAQQSLAKDGVKTQRTPYSPWGLRCEDKTYLARTKAFTKGWVEIQDEGSQLIAVMCDAQPGMQVLDFCAGGGGKTLALASSAMQRKGRIVAMDNDDRRLQKGRQRYKKARIADMIEVRSLNEDKGRKWLRRQKGTFDVVLTDVPCSGTGTWRRNPDMRWNIYGPVLEELISVQADILRRVAPVVKPGGRLVYATCSLLREENENQIEAFLAEHPEFEILPIQNVIPSESCEALGEAGEVEGSCVSKLGDSSAPLRSGQNDSYPYMRLTPHRHGTDGFFAAVLVRKED